MVQLRLRITAGPGHGDELLQALRSALRSVQADGACADAHVTTDVDDRRVLWYWEDWASLEDLERHLRSDRFGRLLAIVERSVSEPLLECRIVTETRGLAYLAAVRGVEMPDAVRHARE